MIVCTCVFSVSPTVVTLIRMNLLFFSKYILENIFGFYFVKSLENTLNTVLLVDCLGGGANRSLRLK